jgi:hypothetical protein
MLYDYLSAIAHVIDYYMNYVVHATPVHPSLCLQYLLYYFYCYRLYFTIAAIILLLPLL